MSQGLLEPSTKQQGAALFLFPLFVVIGLIGCHSLRREVSAHTFTVKSHPSISLQK